MRLFLYSFFIFLIFSNSSFGQGCSDAGFCTMGALKPDQTYSKRQSLKLRSIELSHYAGLTRFEDVIYNYILDIGIRIGKKTDLQIKAPWVRVDGVLKNTRGVGDLSIGLARSIVLIKSFQLNLTLGGKIPLGRNDLTVDYPDLDGNVAERPLPMYYQPSLGTYDLIAGVSMINPQWLFAFGVQHSLNSIENDFVWGKWNNTDVRDQIIQDYPKGRNLNRGTDIMLRVEYNLRFTNFNINFGMLPIYRLNEDEVELPPNNEIEKQEGSKGLALTALLGGGYKFTTRTGLKVMNGFRLIQRDHNPDGLSREFVSNISLYYKF